MVDILIPLVAGILLVTTPDIFLKKDLEEEEKGKKRGFFKKIGYLLIGVSFLAVFSKIMTR